MYTTSSDRHSAQEDAPRVAPRPRPGTLRRLVSRPRIQYDSTAIYEPIYIEYVTGVA